MEASSYSIPFGDVPPPFNDIFDPVEQEIMDDFMKVQTKDGFVNRVVSVLDRSEYSEYISGKTEESSN